MNSDDSSSEKSIKNWAVRKGFLCAHTGDEMQDRVDENGVNQSDVSSSAGVGGSIAIIRKDPSNKDPPILLERAQHALLLSSRLQFFFVSESSLDRPYGTLTSHGQELIFYNCIVTNQKCVHKVYSFQYCVYDGQTSKDRNLVFIGVCANKSKPFAVVCYIHNMERNDVVRIQPSKVSLYL